jgi:deoxyribodipyrimidine photo-lyase
LRSHVRAGSALPPPSQLPAPERWPQSEALDSWKLRPRNPDWAKGFHIWSPGEAGAAEQLERFLEHRLTGYARDRDRPDLPGTSRLSPHLHFGEISPAQAWRAVAGAVARGAAPSADGEAYLRELGWREFCRHLLFHFPDLPSQPWRTEFERFPWRSDAAGLRAWQRGETGYPIVDAGMRELWATGWMHNRVRMIIASFLTKHLLLPWQEGKAWFWDTLVDADLANNAANWQWVAGSGADAAPFFRIFNPVLQGARFDPDGEYVKRWIPELARLPAPDIHRPWSYDRLGPAGVVLGKTYPEPIVDHAAARARALEAYARVKG